MVTIANPHNSATKAIEADPRNPTYRSNRAAAYMSANRYLEALEDSKAADELGPDNPKILLRLARINTALGRPDEALEIYNRIQPPVPAKDKAPAVNMQRYVNEAARTLEKGSSGSMALHGLDLAERHLGPGVERPRKWRLLRGEAYLKMGNVNALGDAQNVAMSLLRSNNNDPEALVLRGRALYAQGENDKAIQHFRQALSCDPDYKDAVRYLRMVQKLDRMKEEGNASFKSGRYAAAVETYSRALEVDPQNKGTNSKILQNRAMCYSRVSLFFLPVLVAIWLGSGICRDLSINVCSSNNTTTQLATLPAPSNLIHRTPKLARRGQKHLASLANGMRLLRSLRLYRRLILQRPGSVKRFAMQSLS